jgi:uncharacterized protein
MRRLAIVGLVLALGVGAAGASDRAGPTDTARYLTMRDGTRIAIDIWLPETRKGRIPTIIRSTRYWRAYGRAKPTQPDSNSAEGAFFTEAGYALVLMDVRGSGASFGRWPHPWSRAELDDIGQVVDWIVSQPWSNGRVGGYGTSYEGNTAEFLAMLGRKAVKAVIPVSNDPDPYLSPAFPGGLLTDWFIRVWNLENHLLDRNDICALVGAATPAKCAQVKQQYTGVKPVDGDRNRRLLRAAVAQHAHNGDVYADAKQVTFRDDHYGAGPPIAAWSPYTYMRQLERGGAALDVWVGWMDAGTVDGALSRFAGARNAQSVLIGPWSHGAGYDADPFNPPNAAVQPTQVEQFQSYLAFFDRYLKGKPRPVGRSIRYYTMNGGGWHTTTQWPPAGVKPQRWFFGPGGSLTGAAPTDADASDRYTVDFSATTGNANRWHTQNGDDVVYPNRAAEDRKLLTYTSSPVPRSMEVTGHPVVTLNVSSTASDGALFVYLEDVAPDGRVTYLTEGELRPLHRKISTRKPPYPVFGPYHSFLRADRERLVPGRMTQLRFALLPTSVLIEKGHRIRIAIAGADRDTFGRLPATGQPVITVGRSSQYPSGVELPVRGG